VPVGVENITEIFKTSDPVLLYVSRSKEIPQKVKDAVEKVKYFYNRIIL